VILSQRQDQRRDRLANLAFLRRSVGHGYYMTNLRFALLVGIALIVTTSDRHTWAFLWMTPAVAGTLLHCLGLTAASYDGTNLWVRRYEAHLARTQGRPRLNLSAVFEIGGSVGLVGLAGHVVSDLNPGLRLLCLVFAVTYTCTVAYAIYDDSAWYNPEVRSPRWQEWSRILCAPQLVVLILALAVFGAQWSPGAYRAPFLVAAYGIVPSILLTLNQFMTSGLNRLVERERQHGTRFVIEQTMRLLEPLNEARRLAEQLGQPQIAALAENAVNSLRDIPQQVVHAGREDESAPLATIADRMAVLVESAGAEMSAHVPADLQLSESDRKLASVVIRDLIGNAIKAKARHIGLTVIPTGARMFVVVTDDGVPMPRGAWRAPGTSSALLAARLRERSGGLRVEKWADQTKAVAANWLTTP
jgi:hypothetical protein